MQYSDFWILPYSVTVKYEQKYYPVKNILVFPCSYK